MGVWKHAGAEILWHRRPWSSTKRRTLPFTTFLHLHLDWPVFCHKKVDFVRRTACQVDPAVRSDFSNSTTSFMPPLARWYATLTPTHPPPMMTVSAESFHLFPKTEDASLKEGKEEKFTQLQHASCKSAPQQSDFNVPQLETVVMPATRDDILKSPCVARCTTTITALRKVLCANAVQLNAVNVNCGYLHHHL